jgi:Protein of unknown function (DUF3277)
MGSPVLGTYSGLDTNFSLVNNPLGISIQGGGTSQTGLSEMIVRMAVTRTVMKTGMDGTVIVSAVPGNWGEVELRVWQTSSLHQQLLEWYNTIQTAANSGDVSNWATSQVSIQNVVDGSGHTLQGVAPDKVPDKTYGTEAQTTNWILRSANITNTPGGA